MKNSKIEWCDHTVNFWWGCKEVSEACKNCYARELSKRFGKNCFGDNPRIFRISRATNELHYYKPYSIYDCGYCRRWNKKFKLDEDYCLDFERIVDIRTGERAFIRTKMDTKDE